jgi:hypothetical protein
MQNVSSPQLPGGLQSALRRHNCLPNFWSKGFPASANFGSKLSQGSDVVSEDWNPHILLNLYVTNVPMCDSRDSKTLGF